jgi:predicted nucleic acid-binding Zn finger protein
MNIVDFEEPYILHLKGVSLSDIITLEDIFNERITSEETSIPKEEHWDQLRKVFTSLEDWPKTINIRCWHCTLKFKSVPWFIITGESVNGSFNVKGNFCSCGCLMGFVLKNYSRREHFDIFHNVGKLYTMITGKRNNNILPAPDIYNLEMYGGTSSMAAYKKELERINKLNNS